MRDLIRKFIPNAFLNWYHFLLAFLGAFFYRFPSKEIFVIGVTGTNGKSTVVDLITKILEEAGKKVAALSSIQFKIKGREWKNELRMTMPGRLMLHRFLRQAVNSGCQYAVLEVTSEGIKQYRHKFIDFKIAVLTNLTPEHIEAHGSFKNYKETKGKLFQTTKETHVINLDDEHAEYFLQFQAREKYFYKIKMQKIQEENKFPTRQAKIKMKMPNTKLIEVKSYKTSSSGLKFFADNTDFNLRLLGEFNIYNASAAICVGLSQGINFKTCKLALEKVKAVPGRMEEVISQPFKVFVDYAFTPNALEKVYQALTFDFKLQTSNKLICVLGATGGGRDKWKRPILGRLAAKYCQEIIITNEDPYDEDPTKIIEQVFSGVTPDKKQIVKKILDRREAIREALRSARPRDLIIITGKGCEPCICVAKGKRMPWDDRQVAKEEFRKISG